MTEVEVLFELLNLLAGLCTSKIVALGKEGVDVEGLRSTQGLNGVDQANFRGESFRALEVVDELVVAKLHFESRLAFDGV